MMAEAKYDNLVVREIRFSYRRKDMGRLPALVFEAPGYVLPDAYARVTAEARSKRVRVLSVETDLPWNTLTADERKCFLRHVSSEIHRLFGEEGRQVSGSIQEDAVMVAE